MKQMTRSCIKRYSSRLIKFDHILNDNWNDRSSNKEEKRKPTVNFNENFSKLFANYHISNVI